MNYKQKDSIDLLFRESIHVSFEFWSYAGLMES